MRNSFDCHYPKVLGQKKTPPERGLICCEINAWTTVERDEHHANPVSCVL